MPSYLISASDFSPTASFSYQAPRSEHTVVKIFAGVRFQNSTSASTFTLRGLGGVELENNGHIGSIFASFDRNSQYNGSLSIENNGTVEGDIYSGYALFNLYNSGTIYGSVSTSGRAGDPANFILADDTTIVNSGVITGRIRADVAIDYQVGGHLDILNTGRINRGVAIEDVLQSKGGFSSVIRNYGAIQGEIIDGAFHTPGSLGEGTFLLNAGAVDRVLFGTKDDVYRTIGTGFSTGGVYGRDGNDRLIGGQVADDFFGGAGNDVLFGRQDDDHLEGGTGADRLYGGAGEDVFAYTSVAESRKPDGIDVIYDFNRDQDVLDLEGIVAGELTYIDDNPFSGRGDAELRCVLDARRVMHVYADTNGDGDADFHIVLRRQTAILNDDDFLL